MLSASASGPRSLKNTTKSLEAPRRHRRTIWSVFCYATRMRVRVRRSLIVRAKGPFSETGMSAFGKAYGAAFRGCEQITFNAETAEAAEKKCLKISLRALRALRSNVAFFHRLFRRTLPVRLKPDTTNINFVHFEKPQPAQLANLGPAMIWQQNAYFRR